MLWRAEDSVHLFNAFHIDNIFLGNTGTKMQHHFPEILYGDNKTVHLKVRKIVRLGWKESSWGNTLQTQRTISNPTNKEMWLDASDACPSKQVECWRLYSIGYSMRKMIDGNYSQENLRKYDHLMLSGMDNYWFTLGTLYLRYGSMFLRGHSRGNDHANILVNYLGKFIKWLPEIFGDEINFRGPQCPESPVAEKCFKYYPWQVSVSAIIYELGWSIDQDKRIPYSSESLLKYMVNNGIIEKSSNGRWALNAATVVCKNNIS